MQVGDRIKVNDLNLVLKYHNKKTGEKRYEIIEKKMFFDRMFSGFEKLPAEK